YPAAYAPPAGEAAEPAAYTPSSYARKKKKASPLPVILGGVVAVVVIGGGAAFLLTRGGDDKEKPGKTTAGADKTGTGGEGRTSSAPQTPAVDPPVANDNAPGFPDPAAAVRAYVAALEAGGKSGIAKATVGLTSDRFAAIEPSMALSGSARQLENAAIRKFGEPGRGTVPPGVALTTESCAGARLTVSAAPPNAVATVAGFGPIPVRKTPTGWKVDLAAMYPDAKAAAAKADGASAAQGKLVQMLAKVMEDVANPKSTTYGSAEQLKADVAAKLAELKIPGGATTSPAASGVAATRPSVAVAPVAPAAPAVPVAPPPVTRPTATATAPTRKPVQFDEGPKAMKIAFVCDSGGPLAKHLPVVRRELNTVIRSLSTKQSFVVVFAGPAGTPATTTGAELTPVTPASRDAAEKFLADYEPPAADQTSDVAAAVEVAAALRPDLIYVLVGVNRADGPEVLGRVPQLSGGAKVNVIVMASAQDESRAGAAAVDATKKAAMAAARRTGGSLNVVRPEELDK
ncbi:MAG TPA: hypothetical protein VF796_19700, partial [Humisphaera sp.]